MTAEADIIAINDGGSNTAAEARAALTSVLARADAFPTFSGVSVYRTTDQLNFTSGADTAIAWDAEKYDTDTYHDNSTNPSRLTVPADGKYLLTVHLGWMNATSGDTVYSSWKVDGGSAVRMLRDDSMSGGNFSANTSVVIDLSSGSYVEVFGLINGSSTTDLRAIYSYAMLTRVG